MTAKKKVPTCPSNPVAPAAPEHKSRRPGGDSIAQSLLGDMANVTTAPGKMSAIGTVASSSAAEVIQGMHGTVHAQDESSDGPPAAADASKTAAAAQIKSKSKPRRPRGS